MELSEADVAKMNHGRMVRSEAIVILPMLARRKEQAVTRLTSHFRGGDLDKLTAIAAEINCYEELEREIKRRIGEAENIERKIHAEDNGNGD